MDVTILQNNILDVNFIEYFRSWRIRVNANLMLPQIDTVVTNKRKKETFSFFYTRFFTVRDFLQSFYTQWA